MRRSSLASAKLISPFILLLGLAFCPCVSAQFNPVQAAKDAYNKAKQQQQQKSQQQGQQQTQQPNQQQAGTPDNSASQPATASQPAALPASTPDQPASADTQSASAGTSAQAGGAWKPPSDSPGATAAPAGPPDFSKFPDISGLRLGMSLPDAMAVMKKLFPRGVGQMNIGPFGPQHQSTVGLLRAQGDGVDQAAVDLTAPPNAPVVWHISRDLVQQKVAHNVIVAGLRQKFGKETYADYRTDPAGKPMIDDSQIRQMWWVFDEQGHLAPQAKMIGGWPFGCRSSSGNNDYIDFAAGKDQGLPAYCTSSYVGVHAAMSTDAILTELLIDIVDLPLMVRSAKATGAWAKGQDDKARQEELQREKQMKPQL